MNTKTLLVELVNNISKLNRDYTHFKDKQYESIAEKIFGCDEYMHLETRILEELDNRLVLICAGHFVNYMVDGCYGTYYMKTNTYEFYNALDGSTFTLTPTEIIQEIRNDLTEEEFEELLKNDDVVSLIKVRWCK